MIMPCEVAVKSLIPSIRAFISKELTQSYQMKQSDVAKILGITQTAVSKYTREVRGAVLKIDDSEEIRSLMLEMSSQIADGKLNRQDLALMFCRVCVGIRRNGTMCLLCQRSDPTIDIRACQVCKSDNASCTHTTRRHR